MFLLSFYASAGRALLAPSRQELGLNHQESRLFGNPERPAATLQVSAVNTAIDELEAEVAECLVGFGHAVNFVTLFHGAATAFGGFHQLIGQAQ